MSPPERHVHRAFRFAPLVFLVAFAWGASAQTVTWSDSFLEGQAPTGEQCQNWTNFLNQLGQKTFASVTISGTFDGIGKTITDPVAATQLAALLSSRTSGTITSGSHYWTVGICGNGACGELSLTLSVDGNQATCDCLDTYAIKPHSQTSDWGGINTPSCDAVSQTMRLVFNSPVSVSANGPTTICPGDNVVLTANTQYCAGPYNYVWSNGATTESITVTEAGSYFVTVTGSDGCSGTSSSIDVTLLAASVNAGSDVTYCEDAVQLNATGNSASSSAISLCLFDSPGGADNCTFLNDLCAEGAEFVTNQAFSNSVSVSNPTELRFLLYYSPFTGTSNFTFRLNDQIIGTFVETNPTGTCVPGPFGQYPRTISFSQPDFKLHWNDAGSNTLSVEIVAGGMGVYLGGISAEVVSSNESYTWSPATGLSDASIRNPLASPDATTLYTVTFTNANGCTSTDQVEVKVNCDTSPAAVCQPVIVAAGDNCQAIVEATAFDGGSTSNSGGNLTFTVTPAGPYDVGETDVTLTVTDSNGGSSSCTTTITVNDVTLPVIISPTDIVVTNDANTCAATITLEQPQALDNCGIQSVTNDRSDNVFTTGETIVTWTVTDIHGNLQTAQQKILVTNNEPVINSVTASPSLVETNNTVTLSVAYTDNNVKNATIDWGDLSVVDVVESPETEFNATHAYSSAGTYAVTVTLTDQCESTRSYTYESVVVIDQRFGSVRGSGWFYSSRGNYLADPLAEGKAQFGFDAQYQNGASVPVGTTRFKFKAGKLQFRSTQHQLLVVDGQKAFLHGIGSLNGREGYSILISIYDDTSTDVAVLRADGKEKGKKGNKNSDRIRVKISDPQGSVVYDTQLGSADEAIATTYLGAGFIQINGGTSASELEASDFQEGSASVYPNPFVDWITVRFVSSSDENINVHLMDMTGKVIFSAQYEVNEAGSYSFEIPEGGKGSRIYILKITQGRRVEFIRLVRS